MKLRDKFQISPLPALLCTDCKWMGRDSNDGTPICKRPGLGRKNVVTGGMLYPRCDEEREYQDWFMNLVLGKTCGVEPKYFQPKNL